MTADREAQAREVAMRLVRGDRVGAGDGDKFTPRAPSVDQLAGALLAERLAGVAEGLERAINAVASWHTSAEGVSQSGGALVDLLTAIRQQIASTAGGGESA